MQTIIQALSTNKEVILKYLGVVFGGMTFFYGGRIYKFILDKFSSKENKIGQIFIKNTEVRSQIQDIIIEIIGLTRANRVSLVEFHNGEEAHSGLPFNYASMTYEKTDLTTKNIITEHQRVPIGSISKMLIDLHNNKDGCVKITQTQNDQEVLETINYYGIETLYNFRITNHIKDGMISIVWFNSDKEKLDNDTISILKIKVRTIRDLMKNMKKYK